MPSKTKEADVRGNIFLRVKIEQKIAELTQAIEQSEKSDQKLTVTLQEEDHGERARTLLRGQQLEIRENRKNLLFLKDFLEELLK